MTTAPPTGLAGPELAPRPPSRRRQRRDLLRRQRRASRWRWLRNGLVALVAATLVLAAVWALTARTSFGPGGDDGAAGDGRGGAGGQSVAVLVQRDGSGAVSAVTVLAVDAGGEGGHLVYVPPGTMTELPSFGLDPLAKSLALGGDELLRGGLENILGMRLEDVTVVDDAELRSLVSPAGTLRVQVPATVEQVDDAGRVNVAWQQGETSLRPEDVPAFLSTRGQGNDLARLARHQAFWTAFLERVDEKSSAVADEDGREALVKAVGSLAKGEVRHATLPVKALDAGGGGQEIYRVAEDELAALLKEALPSSPAAVGPRVRVQILNGNGAVGQSLAVAHRLAPIGAKVVLTGNANSFAYPETQVVYYDRSQRDAAERVQKALGLGKVVFARERLDVADVTVVVGKDFVSGESKG